MTARGRLLAKAGIGVVLSLLLVLGVWRFAQRTDPVFESVVPGVETAISPPQYYAEIPHSLDVGSPGLIVRSGDFERQVRPAGPAAWLNDGRLVLNRSTRYKCDPADAFPECTRDEAAVLDPGTGRLGPLRGLGRNSIGQLPGEALHRLNLSALRPTDDAPEDVLLSFAPDLSSVVELEPPREPDGPTGSGDLLRNLDRRVFSIGDWSYVRFSDNDGEDATQEYGYLRQRQGEKTWEKVLIDQRIITLWVSRDGAALLGLQQVRGEPCGGCSKSQQIVEIDPEEGEVAATYGVPDSYQKSWRVAEVDKMGDRVLVRYLRRSNTPQNLGVWQYDGDWSLVDGTDGAFTWWQGPEDRLEARVPDGDPDREGVVLQLVWVRGDREQELPGQLAAESVEDWRGAPGTLVPPA